MSYKDGSDTPRQIAYRKVQGQLANWISEGGSINGFAKITKRDRRGVQRVWQRICEDMGEQAI